MVVAQFHWATLRERLKKAKVGARDKIPAELKAAGNFVLSWLELACDHGQPEGCLQSARLAKDLGENQIAQKRAFQAHTSGLPEGSFALAVLTSDRKEQRRLLEALCESERSNLRTGAPAISAYEVYGALEGCGSLADSLLKENQLERAAKINERICLAKQQRSTDEGDSSDRSSIRKACERGASLFPRDRIVRCREAVRGSALRVSQRRDLGRRRSRGVDWVQQQGHSRYPVRSVERFLLR